jgi:hypothetical protein
MILTELRTVLNSAVLNTDSYATLRVGVESDINKYAKDSPLWWWRYDVAQSLTRIQAQNNFEVSDLVNIYVVKQHNLSADNESDFDTVAEMEVLAKQFLLHLFEVALPEVQFEFTNITITPVIKFKAVSTYTGVSIQFSVVNPNTVDIC